MAAGDSVGILVSAAIIATFIAGNISITVTRISD